MITSREQIKRDIKKSILRFERRISVANAQAGILFEEVLSENPQLLYYISGYRASGSIAYVQISVEYSNTDVPYENIKMIASESDLEKLLHKSVEDAEPKAVACVPTGMNVNRIYSDFNVAYGGYYSNLTNTTYETSGYEGMRFFFVTFKFKYRIGKEKLNEMERQVDSEVLYLSGRLFHPDMTKEEKAYVAHNYLAKSVEYWRKDGISDLDVSYMQSAFGALINHRCVCQGYAEAYKRLLDYIGIECYVICGKIKGSNEYHAWNVVTFDGLVFYHVDVTWDSRGGGEVSWEYFCLSDRKMQPTRLWSRLGDIVCNSDKDITSIAKKRIIENKLKYACSGLDRKYLF